MNREYIPWRLLLLCWNSPGEICYYLYLWICAVLTLTTWCSRTTLLCCILPGKTCCCLYQRICPVLTLTTRCPFEFAVLYKCWKNRWMNPRVSALFTVFLTEKWTGFPKKCFSPERLFQIFFHSYNTLFWGVSTSIFLCLRHISSL